MSHAYQDDRAFRAFNDRRHALETSTATWGSTVLATLAGFIFVFKALEALGFPVWLWVHTARARIGVLGRISTPPAFEETTFESGAPATIMRKGRKMMGSLLGLNGTNLLQKGVKGVRALSTSTGASDIPPGLGNWDNSCFQNSVIQGLASLPSLRRYLSESTAEHSSLGADTTTGALCDIIRQLSNPNHPGGHFWIRGKLKNMSTFQQQDAQEYYSKVLDALDKEAQSASKRVRRSSSSWSELTKSLGVASSSTEPAIRHNPLDGLLAQRVGCTTCGYSEGLQLISFNCLTVSLGGSGSICDIRDCLDEFTTLEYIEGVECAKCTLLHHRNAIAGLAGINEAYAARLQAVEQALENDDFDDKTLVKKFNILKKNWRTTTKSKQAVIARPPKALVMHVNRSIFDEWTGYQRKNEANVQYPSLLDLGNWCLGKKLSDTNAPNSALEEWPRDPTKSMLGDTHTEPVLDSPFQYRLRAAVTHSGTHGSGHYVCYRPHPTQAEFTQDMDEGEETAEAAEQWWRFSDESVWAVAEDQAAHQGNVFMLFYERIDEPISLTSDDPEAPLAAVPIPGDMPLPPSDVVSVLEAVDSTIAAIPLPVDDDDDDLAVPDLTSTDAPTPPTSVPEPSTPVERPPTPPSFKSKSKRIESDTSAYLTPPPDTPTTTPTDPPSTTPSETDSEDTQDTSSTVMTPKDETTMTFDASQLKISPRMHLMRTAGESPSRGRGNSMSLPMVTAT
ncbi:cysteine proteinase [Massarina eburnea CBS 473.64]|uniref:ubiquitinyl hydrolase 1 n=1 Tax=Massarina eburnea CBS 473.64 TaxID=1395130 RepID=A0A6A6SIK0_9PLEO|nr:cysteine proteinase [Massarina eburnea CBS 473.64]